MRKLLLFTILAVLPSLSFGQAFEAWVGGGVSNLTNTNIGSIDGTLANTVVLQNGWVLNFRLGLNTWRYFGHEIGYQYSRANWNIAGSEYGSSIHEGNYNFLAYFVPEGKRVRPYVTGGGEFANFPFPGYSASYGGSNKWGYNYGVGIKVRLREILGMRLDYRRHSLGKPFDLPFQEGRLGQNEFSIGFGVML